MKIAALQYQFDPLVDFTAYAQKISRLVDHYAKHNQVDLILFPEYAGYEMIAFASLVEMQALLPKYLQLFKDLSVSRKVMICSGSLIEKTPHGAMNRSYFFSPSGKVGYQDKCNLTPDEVNEGILTHGNRLHLFETAFGKIGICICYDVEFPSLARRLVEMGARLILVPSYTTSVHGFYRVFLSCRTRALENQCYVAQSVVVGKTDTEMTYGAAAICSPVDHTFPEDGLLSLGKRDIQGEVICDLHFEKLEEVRKNGQTHNHVDELLFSKRSLKQELFDLR